MAGLISKIKIVPKVELCLYSGLRQCLVIGKLTEMKVSAFVQIFQTVQWSNSRL